VELTVATAGKALAQVTWLVIVLVVGCDPLPYVPVAVNWIVAELPTTS
jgi:hypothetical protein